MSDFIKKTSLRDLLIIERPTHGDERGFFREVFHMDELEEVLGYEFKPIQWNHSRSKPKVLRGQHAENWNKLIYPVTGAAFAAIVDIRPESETFGRHEIFEFDDNHKFALFIPKGFANSFYVKGSEDLNYLYLVDAYWDGSDTTAIAWNDPDVKIAWPDENPVLSQRDQNNSSLRDLFPDKFR